MANLWETTGNLVFLRANDLGTGYGPPTDFLDVEAVFIQNSLSDGARGFQMRNDQYLPARQAMFSLLRDAFVHNLPVTGSQAASAASKTTAAAAKATTAGGKARKASK
jgi:hypothetical protein